MSKLFKKFSSKEWNDCCGKLCIGCEIAASYKKKFGKKKGGRKLMKAKKKVVNKTLSKEAVQIVKNL